MELLVHAWDFARATGQELPGNDGLATYVLGLAKDGLIQPALRDGDAFGDEVAVGPDADPMAQLTAYTGRQPALTQEGAAARQVRSKGSRQWRGAISSLMAGGPQVPFA